ncbi:MAG: hypothetical protein KIB10_05110 [Enterococcus avium]|uniref:hypothetical protein n=1 Tax=Enterococcus avium TaxID=33945 RepID=UPI0003AAED78|nr:hypothetical protein [Enterococcus avium]MDB1727762.1 hypothetical protein [Enterococcus avium]
MYKSHSKTVTLNSYSIISSNLTYNGGNEMKKSETIETLATIEEIVTVVPEK